MPRQAASSLAKALRTPSAEPGQNTCSRERVPAYVATAMRVFADRYTWQDFMAEMDELHGPVPDEAYQWADEQLARVAADAGPHDE